MILKYVYIYITMFYMCVFIVLFSNLYLYNTVLFCVNKYIIIIYIIIYNINISLYLQLNGGGGGGGSLTPHILI